MKDKPQNAQDNEQTTPAEEATAATVKTEPAESSAAAPETDMTPEPAEAPAPETGEAKEAPKKEGILRRFFGAIGHFFKKHKVLGVLLVVLILVVALVLRSCAAVSAAAKTLSEYSFVRTTTLSRGDLTNTVSTTGTVESADTSTVTYSAGTTSLPKFTAVNVAVGDTVKEGDVIATLDTADIEDSIAKEQENISDQVTKAQTTYDRAVTSYNDIVDKYTTQQTETATLLKMVQDDRDAMSAAEANITALQAINDSCQATLQAALSAYNDAENARIAADAALQNANTALNADPTNVDLQTAAANAATDATNAANAAAAKQIEYNNAQTAAAAAELNLTQAQNDSTYTALSQQEKQDDQSYESANAQLETLESQVTQAKQNVDDAKTALDSASDSDTLDTLKDQLDACSLTAATSGKVTSLNASVGSTPSGTIATIQDVDNLKVSITISESDINTIATGMTCQITTDAFDDTISGTLTQIDPVAGETGTFGAEVTVTDTNTALKIGMNATVKIILSNTADCFTVPIDAVGNDNDGKGDYIYRKTGGEGVDMTFDKVYVTTGDSNDYYIEIDSADLAEGDVVRSSADLTQGIVTTDATSNLMEQMNGEVVYEDGGAPAGEGQGGGQGGERPSGGQGGAPAGGQ